MNNLLMSDFKKKGGGLSLIYHLFTPGWPGDTRPNDSPATNPRGNVSAVASKPRSLGANYLPPPPPPQKKTIWHQNAEVPAIKAACRKCSIIPESVTWMLRSAAAAAAARCGWRGRETEKEEEERGEIVSVNHLFYKPLNGRTLPRGAAALTRTDICEGGS